jgi:hypothetical protein
MVMPLAETAIGGLCCSCLWKTFVMKTCVMAFRLMKAAALPAVRRPNKVCFFPRRAGDASRYLLAISPG